MNGSITDARFSRRSILQAAGFGVAATALSSCSSGGTSNQPATGPIQRGGTLTIGWLSGGAAESLDPASGTQQPDFFRVFNLYDPLWRRGKDGAPELCLLESGEPNEDASVWTLKLRDGVTFHNGKTLTADDLLYTIRSWSNPDHGAYGIASSNIKFSAVKKLDKMTVQVPLQRGITEFPSLISRLNFVVIADGSDPSKEFIGTGPFKYESFQAGSRSVFTKNSDYWIEGRPYLEQLVIDSSFTDDEARLNALLGGQIDAMPAMSSTQARVQQQSGQIKLLNGPSPQFMTFPMNCQSGPASDLKVRQALKLVVDRQQMVDVVFNGFATVGNDLSPINVPNFASDLSVEQDIDQAKSLLRSAGAEGLTLDMYTSNAFAGQTDAAVLFKEQAAKAGIAVNLQRVPAANFWTTESGWLSYPMSVDLWQTPTSSLTQFYTTLIATNAQYDQTHWATKETDALLYDAMSETDEGRAADKWHALQSMQFETGGYLTFAQPNFIDGLGQNVQGLEASSAGNMGGYIMDEAWKQA